MFKVYTEDTGLDGRVSANALAERVFDSFTVTQGIGCWRGQFEQSLMFEIDTADRARVVAFAKELKAELRQAAVLVVELSSTSLLV